MKTGAVINAMNCTGMVLNLIGFYLNTCRSIWGYFMWMISGPLLFCVMWHEGLMPQMILLSFYFVLTFYGICNWSKGRADMKIDNAMTVFKELPKTNCRECGVKTCLAFAVAVFQRHKAIGDCPHLDKAMVEKFSDGVKLPKAHRAYLDEFKKMRHEIINVDLPDAAERLGGTSTNGKLTVKVMGKDVSVDANGNFYTDIHVNGWVERLVLTAIVNSKGLPVAGGWVKIHDLKGGKPWRHMFENQCVTPLHDLADDHPDLFETLMHVFSGSRVEGHMGSDIGVVLNVLPKVPILICYWKAEEGMNSDLHVFFDNTSSANLGVDALYSAAVGLTQMFKKIAVRHG